MAILQGKTAVASGATSGWVSTDGTSNIIVGVSGGNYAVQYDLGSDIVYTQDKHIAGASNRGVVIAKANQVRVVSHGAIGVDFEVFG